MDDGAKNRLRLWLRAEKAMGLSLLPMPRDTFQTEEAQLHVEVTPEQAPAVGEELRSPAKLFGDVAPPRGSNLMPPPSVEPFTGSVLRSEEKRARLTALDANEVRSCVRCRLCETRRNTVFGEGDAD